MKLMWIVILFFAIDAQAQNIAAVARAERKRQQEVQGRIKVQKAAQAALPAGTAIPALGEPEKEIAATEPEPEISMEQRLRAGRVDLIKKRSEVLVRMDQYKDDRNAVREMEAELMEISKRAESLKREQMKLNGRQKQ